MASLVSKDIGERMVHTERNPEFARIQKERDRERVVADAEVERLPFKDESADVVAGYAMFDTLFNSEEAAEEIKRILKKDGKFIHFLDLGHNEDILIEDYKNKGRSFFRYRLRLIWGSRRLQVHCYASKRRSKKL